MKILRPLFRGLCILAGVECALALFLYVRRHTPPPRQIQAATPTIVIVAPRERTSFADCLFDERHAETVMIVTLDIPGVVKGKRMELPLKQVKESELPDGAFGMECADGANGFMDTSVSVFPEYSPGCETRANLSIGVAWALNDLKGSIDQTIPTRIGETREIDLPNSVHLKIEFRPPRLDSHQ
jgi:hypothetical protein